MGLCALMAKLGGVTTMLLDLLKVYWVPAPVLIMGIFATLAGLAAANFPETAGLRSTNHTSIPQHMDELKKPPKKIFPRITKKDHYHSPHPMRFVCKPMNKIMFANWLIIIFPGCPTL